MSAPGQMARRRFDHDEAVRRHAAGETIGGLARGYGVPQADLLLLDLPMAQPVIARIGANVDPDYPGRMEHVLRVASLAVRAKIAPCNSFAKASL